jgi:hypothetical protein
MRVLVQMKLPKSLGRSVLSLDDSTVRTQEMDGASDGCYDSMRDKLVERSSGFWRGGIRTIRMVIGGVVGRHGTFSCGNLRIRET